ncbi:hypothetical protein [Spirosoma lituiforme]
MNNLTRFLAKELSVDIQDSENKEIDYRNSFSTKDIIFNTFINYSDEENLEAIVTIINFYTNAVEDIKRGKFNVAKTKFENADYYLNELVEDDLSFALVNCFAIPAKALLMYNSKNYKLAFQTLKNSLKYYDTIIDYNPTFFQAFKITQIYHICKVLIKADHKIASFKIMTRILAYLVFGNNPKLKGNFERRCISDMPKQILDSLVAIFIIEIIYVFAEIQLKNKSNEIEYFEFVYDTFCDLKPDGYEQCLLYNWLIIKQKFYKEDYDTFAIEGAKFYNSLKINNFDIIKFSLLLDFLKLNESVDKDDNYNLLLTKKNSLKLKNSILQMLQTN